MKTRILPALLSLVLVLCVGSTEAKARYMDVWPELSFDNTTAECSVVIMEWGKTISATMELWEGNTLLDSWSDSGVSALTLEGSHRAVSGWTYTVEVYGTIGGEAFEAPLVSKTCP